MLGNGHSPDAQPFFLCPLTCLFGHAQAFDPDDGYMPGLHSTVHDQIGVNMTTMEAPLHNKDCAAVGRNSFAKDVSYYLSAGAQDTTCEVCPSCPFLFKHYDYHYADTFGLATAVLPLPLVQFRMSTGSSTSAGLVLPLLLCAPVPVPGADAQVPGPRFLPVRSWAARCALQMRPLHTP